MNQSDLKFLVVGGGAVGGITASLLKRNGIDVEIVCKYPEYATMISEEGIDVSGICGNFKVKIKAYATLDDVPGKKDVVLLATKANDMLEVASSVDSVLRQGGFLMSMQNGVCEEKLATVAGSERIIGCVTGWGATMEKKGKLVMTSTGDFIIGYPYKEADITLSEIARVLSCVVTVSITDNITGHKYSKLIINSCITSLGAICGLFLGKMLMIKKIRNIFIEIIREAVNVADRMEIDIEVFGGRLDFKKFLKGKSIFSDMRRHLMLLIIGYKYRKLKSSGLQSLERGKLTEIDFLNGYIAKNGVQLGVPVPVNTFIVSMIHEIEQNKRLVSPDNFNDPFFDEFI
jgi:2-dehydropantoate 2-reductase